MKIKDPKKQIADEFAKYKLQCIHPQASQGQIEELRMAFFGGAVITVNRFLSMQNLSEEEVASEVAAIHAELLEHLANVAAGNG